MSKLSKFEEEADKREDIREMKRLEFEARMEEKRQQMELQHEEKLMSMFMSFMSHHTYPYYNPHSNDMFPTPTSSSSQ